MGLLMGSLVESQVGNTFVSSLQKRAVWLPSESRAIIVARMLVSMQACPSGQDDCQKQDDIILPWGQSSWVDRMMPVFRAEIYF